MTNELNQLPELSEGWAWSKLADFSSINPRINLDAFTLTSPIFRHTY